MVSYSQLPVSNCNITGIEFVYCRYLEREIISIDFSGTNYFSLEVKSSQNQLIYKTHNNRFYETFNILWDERKLWLDQEEDYSIDIYTGDRFGRTLDLWHWLEESDALFWDAVEMKGFLQCDSLPQVLACFRKGGDQEAVFVSSLDNPSENPNWNTGCYEGDSIQPDVFLLNIDVFDQTLWDSLEFPALQIAAVNQFELDPNLSLLEKVTDSRTPEAAAEYFADHGISFYPEFSISSANKSLLCRSIRQMLSSFSQVEDSKFIAVIQTEYFNNPDSLYLEIWDINPDTFELVISHTRPLNVRTGGV